MPVKSVEKFLDMAKLPDEELASILKQGALLRLPFLEGRLFKAGEEVKRFQNKYRTTLDNLKSQGLPDDADYEMHEDFIEWEYWNDVLNETEMIVRGVKAILEKVEGAVAIH